MSIWKANLYKYELEKKAICIYILFYSVAISLMWEDLWILCWPNIFCYIIGNKTKQKSIMKEAEQPMLSGKKLY